MRMLLLGLGLLFALPALAAPVPTVKPPAHVDDATIAKYKEIGGEYGAARINLGNVVFDGGRYALEVGRVPCFDFKKAPTAELPEVNVPFALSFGFETYTSKVDLSKLDNLEALTLSSDDNHERLLSDLRKCRKLKHLDLYVHRLSTEEIHKVGQLAALESFSLDTGDSGDISFRGMEELEKLKVFNLRTRDLSDAQFPEFEKLVSLEQATLQFEDIREGLLASVGKAKKLNSFTVYAGMKRVSLSATDLPDFARLTKLNLMGVDLGDSGCAKIGEFKKLLRFSSDDSAITDRGLASLSKIKGLTHLALRNSKLTDEGLDVLRGNASIEYLDLSRSGIGDAAVKPLATLPQLDYLRLNGTKITDTSVPLLGENKKLRILDVSKTKITPEGIEKLRKALPKCNVEFKE